MFEPKYFYFSVLLTGALAGGGSEWSYKSNAPSGPDNWHANYPSCGGSKQSPVDIKNTKEVEYDPLELKNYDVVPKTTEISNNGHSAKISPTYEKPEEVPRMSGGGLPHSYKFAQVHFHWGSEDAKGSEHLVEGAAYPMEMHFVHFKTSHATLADALAENAPDSLAVLAIFVQASDTPQTGFIQLLDGLNNSILKNITKANSNYLRMPFPLSLLWGKGANFSKFYRYEGSLTTPACNEVVQWTVVGKPVDMSSKQLKQFRSLLAEEGKPMVDNFRPVQSLGERQVLEVTTKKLESLSSGQLQSSAHDTKTTFSLENVAILMAVTYVMF